MHQFNVLMARGLLQEEEEQGAGAEAGLKS